MDLVPGQSRRGRGGVKFDFGAVQNPRNWKKWQFFALFVILNLGQKGTTLLAFFVKNQLLQSIVIY